MQNKQDKEEMLEQVADSSTEKINIIKDENGKSIVIINDIRFKGRQHIDWQAVEQYLKEYVGRYYEIIETSDKIYIGTDFPNELKGSDDTTRLKGANAKAKANSTQEIPLLLENATNKRWSENFKDKHGVDANSAGIDILHVLRCQRILTKVN